MKLEQEAFLAALDDIIFPDDRVVVIYSGIWSFAHRLGLSAKDAPDILTGWIEEFLGPDRTIVFPTYTLLFPATKIYDPVRTPPDTGVLSQAVVNREGFVRTLQPMNSYGVRGPAATSVLDLPCTTSWGEDGVMGWMRETNARICVLGVPWEFSCSYIHLAEQIFDVPYRFFKTFHGVRTLDGQSETPCSETMFVRSMNVVPMFDFSPAHFAIKETASFRTSNNPFVPIESALAADILNVSLALLKEDPYQFVHNSDAVREWVENEKQQEIDEAVSALREIK